MRCSRNINVNNMKGKCRMIQWRIWCKRCSVAALYMVSVKGVVLLPYSVQGTRNNRSKDTA